MELHVSDAFHQAHDVLGAEACLQVAALILATKVLSLEGVLHCCHVRHKTQQQTPWQVIRQLCRFSSASMIGCLTTPLTG